MIPRRRIKQRQLSHVLAICIGTLAGFYIFGLLLGRRALASGTVSFHEIVGASNLRGKNTWVGPNAMPFDQNSAARNANHLIVVAGHSTIVSGHLQDAGEDESDWFLLDYQKGQGLPQAIKAHIRAGINEARRDPKSLLVFSGGETRTLTVGSEGPSYFHAADAMNMWPKGNVRARTTTEEYALDSFQNLIFSICRFKEITGAFPKHITVVSFTFKQKRFEEIHAVALRWPAGRFTYIGVDPTASTGFDLEKSQRGELQNSVKPFQDDPYGCHGLLKMKRLDRNPFFRTAPYPLSCPEMQDILSWCGPDLIPFALVPWQSSD